ncbi:hypothetical protein [Bradyrhizobium sp. UFLA05-112]
MNAYTDPKLRNLPHLKDSLAVALRLRQDETLASDVFPTLNSGMFSEDISAVFD